MKSVIREKENAALVQSMFPCLYKLKIDGSVMLFITETEGVWVFSGSETDYSLGKFSDTRRKCTDKDHWEKFTGEVVLFN